MVGSTVGLNSTLVAHDTLKLGSGRGSALWPSRGMHLLASSLFLDELARVGNGNSILNAFEACLAFFCGHVDEVDVRQRVEVVLTVRTTANFDRRTVHVELAITNAIVPVPSECRAAIGHVLWQSESEWMCSRVTLRVDGATTFEHLKDLES